MESAFSPDAVIGWHSRAARRISLFVDWVQHFYSTRSRWFGPTGIFPEHRARAADLERLCGPGPKHVLELGAGSGGTAAAMADLGHTVVALELSPVRAAFARELAVSRPRVTVVEGDFHTATVPGPFDVVCYWDGFGVGADADQLRLLRRVRAAWLGPHSVMLLDVFSPAYWVGRAGEIERIETVWRLVSGEVRTVRLDVPMIARYGFDPGSCRFLTEWWPDGHEDETIRETVRCYAPGEFVELLIGTGLAADRFEVDGKPFDPCALKDVSGLLASRRSYRVRLVHRSEVGTAKVLCLSNSRGGARDLMVSRCVRAMGAIWEEDSLRAV